MKTRFIYCFVLSFLMIAIIPSCSYFGASRYDFTPLDSIIRGWIKDIILVERCVYQGMIL